MITLIKDKERGGKAKAYFLESGKSSPDEEPFWKALGGKVCLLFRVCFLTLAFASVGSDWRQVRR